MRWIRYGILVIIVVVAAYALSLRFGAESKTFSVEREIDFPLTKVYPQFSNLQNYTRWNSTFTSQPELTYSFFSPYEGAGSALKYHLKKDGDKRGELFIRYARDPVALRYEWFDGDSEKPYLIDVRFKKLQNRTRVSWLVRTPKQPFFGKSNLISPENFEEEVSRSMKNLTAVLGNKIEQEKRKESIRFDTVFVEQRQGGLLLGVNVNSATEKNALFRNIVMNHNKVLNFVTADLGKKEDEFGTPVLITDADNFKNREISYFYGAALPKRIAVSDNSFTFRTVNASKVYAIYYRGPYSGRVQAIQQLLQRAKKDTMRSADIYQTFLEEPSTENNTVLKLSLPVYR